VHVGPLPLAVLEQQLVLGTLIGGIAAPSRHEHIVLEPKTIDGDVREDPPSASSMIV
jgi:hypothetical protein